MPELPEVEHSRRLWQVGQGAKVLEVIVRNGKSRVFRSVNPKELLRLLSGERFFDSEALGKQLVFRFGQRGEFWLGLHLGMTGELRVEPPKYPFLKYDHLILRQSERSLVFSDQRQFGRVLFAQSNVAPLWWAKLPPSILSDQFKRDSIAKFCHRRKGSALNRAHNLRCALWVGRIGWDSKHLICCGAELCRSFMEFGRCATRNG